MFEFFASLQGLLKLETVTTDNSVFRLHYKVTCILLFAFSLLVTGKEYFGDPIDCMNIEEDEQRFVDTYCWIHSTFTLPGSLNKKVGTEVAHPGVDTFPVGSNIPRTFCDEWFRQRTFGTLAQSEMRRTE